MIKVEEYNRFCHHWRSVGFAATITYAASVSLLAGSGIASNSSRFLLLVATVLTFPTGIVALVGLYVMTGLFNWVAAGFTTAGHGSGGCNSAGHCWSSGTPVGAHGFFFDTCIVILYLGAAVANVLLVREILGSQHRKQGAGS